MDVAEGDAQRDRDQKRDSHRLSADLKVLRGLLPHQPGVVRHEAEGVDEGVRLERVEGQDHAMRLRARAHGVSIRCARTSRPSATIASAIARAAVATNSVVKSVASP